MSAKKEKKKKINKSGVQVFLTAMVFALIFLAMIGNLVLFQMKESDVAYTNSYNSKRVEAVKAETTRGTIYASSGDVLAESKNNENGEEVRDYPYGSLFAHTVGYEKEGASGIEKSMQQYLIRSDISLDEKLKNDLADKKDQGNSVYTSLDPAIQQIAYNSLGDYRGAVVVTEVKTGKILAMVSKPDFDPGTIEENWDEVSSDIENSPLLNRASQGMYPPGSTFKIITALEFIRENPTDWKDYHFTCQGKFNYEDCTIKCFHNTVHGYEDLEESFADSCNSSFANLGTGLNRIGFSKTLKQLYFNEDLPTDVISSPSHISMRQNMTANEICQTSIGQSETLMSPLHLNMITESIANDGVMMKPYMVEKVTTADGRVIKSYEPQELGRVMSHEEAQALTGFMTAVVNGGTGKALSGQPYTAAGKTGSAEFSDKSDISHAWFTGFAPVEDPQIAVTVIMEKAGTGGTHAAPVAKRIFAGYFGMNM